jgi:hypothetical protein
MANLAQITNYKAEYSENILPVTALISDSTTLNYTGDLATLSNNFSFDGGKSIRCSKTMTIVDYGSVFDLGSALTTTVTKDGYYLFSFRVLDNTSYFTTFPIDIRLKVYINSVLSYTFSNIFENGTSENKQWYGFAQSIPLGATDVIDFAFEIDAPYPGTPSPTLDMYIGGFKLELDDRFLSIPSIYSKPKDYDISQTQGYLKNLYHGWGYYVDSLATPTITIGTSYTQITIDALGANITDYLPLEIRGVSELWSGNKITPIAVGDDYDGRFDITVTAKTGTPTLIELIIDISGSTAGTNVAFTGYIQAGGTIPYKQSIDLDYFSLATFLSNGGRLYAKTDSGSITIGRRNIKITRKSKAF